MKKSGVLKKRAALFTATVTAVTVAVSLCGYMLGAWIQTSRIAQDQLRPQLDYLAQKASGDYNQAGEVIAQFEDEAKLLTAGGEYVWFVQYMLGATPVGSEQPFPWESPAANEKRDTTRPISVEIDGMPYVYCEAPVTLERSNTPYIGVAVPVRGFSTAVICAAVAALLGLGLGALAGNGLIDKMLRPALAPAVRLRDAAVAMSEGDLETRADESVEGELGELGKAVNHMADQLSRNMYMLIVERNRLKNMLNGLSEGIVAIDRAGQITHTNPALEKFFTRQKLALHLPDPRMKVIPDKSVWEDLDGAVRSGESMSRNLQSKDMILRLTITPIVDELGTIAGAVGLFSDITQQERLEKTRRDYVSNVSHELRTPLTAMRALIEPLKEGMVTDESDRMRYYDIILREIMRLSRLINDQLELSRLQSGTLSIEKSVMRLDDLVYDVCDRYNTIAAEQGLELRVDTDFTQCPPVFANADRVEQLLIILLDNAIKYTEQGSVAVSADWDEEKVTLHVKDTGIGIEEEDLPCVFDRFYKVDKAHSGKGSGLGLSIAKELLKRMDEDIWVTSEKGVGTEFSFTLHFKGKGPEDGAE